ncbi:unnamed protein product [Aspergillus oryzae]|nr:unnamed protein product [Aspergillus oryzae]GMG06926.1 unnamed protein product [Aspergillus oryzae]
MVRYSGFGLSIQRSWSRINGTSPLPVSQTSADMRPRLISHIITLQLAHLESSSSAARVWGAAYHIPASHAEEVHDYLDEREIDGYSVHYTPFYPFSESKTPGSDSTPITCMVYIGQPTNPQFLRDPARREPQDVAEVISRGRGQSGKNTEYLYLLEKALEGLGLGSADGHVTDLVRRVKAIEKEDEAARDEEAAERDLQKSLSRSEEEAHRAFQNEERA